MSEPFLGEIRLFANHYAPRGWMFCEGQILQTTQYQALYSLLGNVYGGNGVTTFALPDYRGRVPIHVSPSFPRGTSAGEANHTLTINEMPQHTHQVSASSNAATSPSPLNNAWAAAENIYGPAATMVQMNQSAIGTAGGSQPHNNMQPYLVLNYAIAIQGIYPSRN
ncbi:tail fiber protein [Brevibacillus ruminantium]|uniref:Tail fiber protein n=1 Tax=Brevibacillus ruminantium TaxID=2950604 RepID=A0ABY4WDC2_9BACL|nr:tail fiber protein [Brevibacillus ruminantium]USG65062.1 tail fiber protein [Brevibacillus ruminantium]